MGTFLVCCNVVGVNAFFVHADYANLFPCYTIQDLYMPTRYHFAEESTGHKSSFCFLKDILNQT